MYLGDPGLSAGVEKVLSPLSLFRYSLLHLQHHTSSHSNTHRVLIVVITLPATNECPYMEVLKFNESLYIRSIDASLLNLGP